MKKSKDKNPYSVPLRQIPKRSPWYHKVKSPYMSKREGKNTVKGFLILCAFLAVVLLLIFWVAVYLSD